MKLLSPTHWHDYELIDSGDFEKLERFGPYRLIRPEPQAIWKRQLPDREWQQTADARFIRDASGKKPSDSGGWKFFKKLPESWHIPYTYGDMHLSLKLTFTTFGHIGVFPEQSENWDFIYDTIRSWKDKGAVLNLFAYTGGASLAARAAGSDVTHVDAVKSIITWANANAQASHTDGIRWIVEDALKFVQREVRRGRTYKGIIMDPPAYGRGPNGEKWILEEGLTELVELSSRLLDPVQGLLIVNLYSMGLSALVSANLVQQFFKPDQLEFGELFLPSTTGQRLPLGTYARFRRG